MTLEEARQLAKEEGLQLVPAATASGFKGVYESPNSANLSRPFSAQIKRHGKPISLGCARRRDVERKFCRASPRLTRVPSRAFADFSSAAEASLAVARHLGPVGCALACAPPPSPEVPMTEAEMRRLAEKEGLTLVLAPGTATGYKGVTVLHGTKPLAGCSKPYAAKVRLGGVQKNLGTFTSAAEAALTVARRLGPAGSASAAAAPQAPLKVPKKEREAKKVAEAAEVMMMLAPPAAVATPTTVGSKRIREE